MQNFRNSHRGKSRGKPQSEEPEDVLRKISAENCDPDVNVGLQRAGMDDEYSALSYRLC